jgi:hypothetical protein
MGPYSPALTSDYYSLAEAIALGDHDWEGKALRDTVKNRLDKIRPLLAVPAGVHLAQQDWLELLASLHYLRVVHGHDQAQALRVLMDEKAQLVAFVTSAQLVLAEAGLLPADG